ncbi:hypothetical protein [Haloarcula sp. 1CSR25-25]|uniref:hypothetical protein n=1 Tax=Haloarcula sp. 1CSR25-25 TaxID=2862545 RepID=UPI0028945FE2|nr:hypothetical protein [Haloarcula sp. 1CSR25-25]MDT3435462.1 hypothetical protein [Haloarcula sp. 1CSR25-25]
MTVSATRESVTLSMSAIAISVFYTHETERLFPELPIGISIAVTVLLLATYFKSESGLRSSFHVYLGAIVVIAVFYRSYIFLYPASLIGLDPISYSVQISRVMITGSTDSVSFFFYSRAPLSIILPAFFGLVSGLSAPDSLVVYSILGGIVPTLVIAGLAKRTATARPHKTGIVAGALASIAAVSVHFSFWPIAQTLSVYFWIVLILLLVRYYERSSKRTFLLLIGVLVGLTFTHKLPLFITIFVLLLIAGFSKANRLVHRRILGHNVEDTAVRRPLSLGLGLVVIALLLVQWSFITDFIKTVAINLLAVFSLGAPEVSSAPAVQSPSAAAPPNLWVIGLLYRRSHGISFLIVGGLAWLLLLIDKPFKSSSEVLLSSVAGLVFLLVASVISRAPGTSAPPPMRMYAFLEPILVVLVAVGIERLSSRGLCVPFLNHRLFSSSSGRRALKLLSVTILALLVVSQAFSTAAVPDHRAAPRYYLTSGETQAKSFGLGYTDSQITTDWFTTVAGPPDWRLIEEERSGPRYRPAGESLLNANLTRQGYHYIMYRPNVRIYATGSGPWVLEWNPERQLDSEYSRIYANGDGLIYAKSPDEAAINR